MRHIWWQLLEVGRIWRGREEGLLLLLELVQHPHGDAAAAQSTALVQAVPRVDVRVVSPARFSEVAVQVTPGVVRAVASINMCAWLAQPVQLSKQHASQPA